MPPASGYILIATVSRVATQFCVLARTRQLEPYIVSDGEAALAVMKQRGVPELLVVDPSLAKIDGFTVVRLMRAMDGGDAARVMIVSPHPHMRAVALGLRDVLGISHVCSSDLDANAAREAFRHARSTRASTAQPDIDEEAARAAREEARLGELDRLELISDAPPDATLTAELESIARSFGVSTVLVSLVLRDRCFFKAHHGLEGAMLAARGAPRESSFCRHIVEADHPVPLVVPDAYAHPAFARNPAVLAGIVGSYVGVPLTTPEGHVLGSLCLVDRGSWLGSAAFVDALTHRARGVMDALLGRVDPNEGKRRTIHVTAGELLRARARVRIDLGDLVPSK